MMKMNVLMMCVAVMIYDAHELVMMCVAAMTYDENECGYDVVS